MEEAEEAEPDDEFKDAIEVNTTLDLCNCTLSYCIFSCHSFLP